MVVAHSCLADLDVRTDYDPVKQRQETRGGGADALPMPIAASRLTVPMAGEEISFCAGRLGPYMLPTDTADKGGLIKYA